MGNELIDVHIIVKYVMPFLFFNLIVGKLLSLGDHEDDWGDGWILCIFPLIGKINLCNLSIAETYSHLVFMMQITLIFLL